MAGYVSKEERTDYLGAYTAYTYADGHVETDPPARPVTKEDAQRLRLREASRTRAQRLVEAQRSRTSSYGTAPADVVRENSLSTNVQGLLGDYETTLKTIGALASTFRGNIGQTEQLVEKYDLGGKLVGSTDEDQAYGDPAQDRGPEPEGPHTPRYPTKGR